jgi:hypothetical protein
VAQLSSLGIIERVSICELHCHTDYMKKSIIIILALSSILTACSRRDTKLTQAVSGSWRGGTSREMVMSPDGSFSQSFHFPKGTLILAGTWQIKDGILIWTTTNVIGPEPHVAVGTVDRSKIVSVDAHRLVYEGHDQGQKISLSR